MKNNLITGILLATVAIILTASLLAPVLDSNTLKSKEFADNVGTLYYNDVDAAEISVALGDNFAVTIDGTPIEINHYDPIAICDSFMLVRSDANGINICSPVENKFILGDTTGTTLTLTMENGTYTATLGEQSFSGTYSDLYVRGATGDYIQQNTATINPGDKGIAYIGAATWGAKQGIATISDFDSGSATYSLKTYTDFQVTGSTDTTLTWDVHDNDNGSYDVSTFVGDSIDPIVVILPAEYYTYEANEYSGLLNAIIPLVIVAIILGVLGMIYVKRSE